MFPHPTRKPALVARFHNLTTAASAVRSVVLSMPVLEAAFFVLLITIVS